MIVLGVLFNEQVAKVTKNKKIIVLGTYSTGTLQKYLKMKKKYSFRYFSNGYVAKVPKNQKMLVLGTFQTDTLLKYLKMKKKCQFQVLFQLVHCKST